MGPDNLCAASSALGATTCRLMPLALWERLGLAAEVAAKWPAAAVVDCC